MQTIFFKSSLPSKFKNEVERIFFFNTNQKRHHKKIEESIEMYGVPHILSKDNQIFFSFDKIASFQVLYALDDDGDSAILLGIILFYRDFSSNMKIIHIAVDENCSSSGEYKEETIAARLVNEVRKISLAIKDVKTISLPYSNYKISLRTDLSF